MTAPDLSTASPALRLAAAEVLADLALASEIGEQVRHLAAEMGYDERQQDHAARRAAADALWKLSAGWLSE